MIRKLIQLSPSTAVVSLPSSWIKANKLKKGAPIHVEEQENNVIVSTSLHQTPTKEIILDLSTLNDKLMWTSIDAAYIAGYDTITLLTKDATQKMFMTKVVRYFPGMILYEEKKNQVQFKSIAENPEEDLDKILSRIFNLNLAMLEDALESLKTKNWDVLSKMKYRDYNINTYISYCLRHLNKNKHRLSKTGMIYTYIKIIEMMSDKFAALFVNMGENSLQSNQTEINLIHEMYQLARTLHFKFNQESIILLEDKRQHLKEKIKEAHPLILPQLTEIAELFYDFEELELQLNT